MRRLILILTLALLTAGCSGTEMAYRNADQLLKYYSWQTVRSSSEQRAHWQPLLESTLQQHREQELSLVVAYLDIAVRIIRETDSAPGAECLVDGATILYQRHAHLAVELAVPLLLELDSKQIEHLSRRTTKRQQKLVKQYLNPDRQRRMINREKRLIKRIEHWTGTLTASQRQQVSEAIERIPDLSQSWLAQRKRQTDTLLKMLENGTDPQALREHLEGWWIHRAGYSAETTQQWHVARHEFIQLMDGLATTLSEKQRTKIEDRLVKVRGDLVGFVPTTQPVLDRPIVPSCDPGAA